MYAVIETDEFEVIEALIRRRIETGQRLDMTASQKGDLMRFQINTVEDELDEDDVSTNSGSPRLGQCAEPSVAK